MFQRRTGLVLAAVCLVGGLAALGGDPHFVGRDGVAEGATSECDSASPVPDAAVAAFVNNASVPALEKGPSEGWRISPRPLCQRLVLPSLSSGSETHWRGLSQGQHAPNWIPSYLPESEFCTVLSRFRI